MSIVSLQALRALAALGVVLFHLLPFESKYLPGVPIVPLGFGAGRAGVDLFFVLSGFLAVWTSVKAPAGAASAGHFLMRRMTRIYPTYWFYCLPLLVLAVAAPAALSDGASADLVSSLLLFPSAAPPLLLVAWTLEFELYFYLVFAVIVWAPFDRRGRMMALAAWGAAVLAGHVMLAPARSQVLLDFLVSPLVFEFLAGCAVGYVCRRGVGRATWICSALVGCVVLCFGLVWSEALFALPGPRVIVFGAGCSLLLVGCFGAEATLRRVLPKLVIRVGDASYSLYLSHLFVLGAVGRLLTRLAARFDFLATPAGHAIALGAVVLVALIVADGSFRWVETPLLRLTRYLTDRRQVPRGVTAS